MKKCLLTISVLLFLISCGKSEKQNEDQNTPKKISYHKKDSIDKAIPIYIHDDYKIYIENVDTALLSKVATNLKIPYADINIEESSSIAYNNSIVFLIVSFKSKDEEQPTEEGEDMGYFLERKYVFVSKKDGQIIAEETDNNLGYFDDEATGFSKTYVLKNTIKLNESTNAIGMVTETSGGGNVNLYSRKLFTIITLKDNKINKILYEYPVRKTDGDSNGGGSFQMESLETNVSVSNTITNGFNDLIVSKNFSFENEVEGNLEKGIKDKVAPVKTKNDSEILKYNGSIYSFKKDDKLRFWLLNQEQ